MEVERPRMPELQAPDERTIARLGKIPWCAELLKDEKLTVYISPSTRVKPDFEDSLFSSTLNSNTTVADYVVLYRQPQSRSAPIMELKCILALGSDVNGFPNVCHGGIVATLLDEVMGELTTINKKHRTIKDGSYMTAYLNTSYKGKVATPGTFLVVARMSRMDGRKVFISATVEDGEGGVLARGEALFIRLREPIGRL